MFTILQSEERKKVKSFQIKIQKGNLCISHQIEIEEAKSEHVIIAAQVKHTLSKRSKAKANAETKNCMQ